MNNAALQMIQRATAATSPAPRIESFVEFQAEHDRVRKNDGSYVPYSLVGRKPLQFCVELISAIIRNTAHGHAVEIDGTSYKAGALQGSTVSICGGAQFGKTVLELNFAGYAVTIEFLNFGYYTPDRELLEKIVDTKFRPDVIDQVPWIAEMITLGKAESASGKAVHKKNSFQATDGSRKAFGHFCGMQKPPTTISLDIACCDEVDDIPERNMGFVLGRMTNSRVRLAVNIGTQRIYGAGQHKRFEAGTQHTWRNACAGCGLEHNLEEEFPACIRLAVDGTPRAVDPRLAPELPYDPDARYYYACTECGHPIDPDQGQHVALKPERTRQRNWSIRISQLGCSAISANEIAAAWYAALADPSGDAMVAFYCDRVAIPKASAAQPINPEVLARARGLEDYAMSLTTGTAPRFAGMDPGPRCWLWVDEIRSPLASACVWAEMMASERAPERVTLLMELLGIQCVFIDQGGEPDLTKRLVLALNGLADYQPPALAINELEKAQLYNIGAGCNWNGAQQRWENIRAAAVLFTASEARGIQHTIGHTQSGQIYPLIKCNRAETLQAAVNDFLTPAEGVVELVQTQDRQPRQLRQQPRARLPRTCIGPGVTLEMLDRHLQNLRRVKDPKTGREDWADGIENHTGLAKAYARLASTMASLPQTAWGTFNPATAATLGLRGGNPFARSLW